MSPAASSQKKRKAAQLDAADSNEIQVPKTRKRTLPFSIEIGKRPAKYGHLLGCGQNEVGQLGFEDSVTEKSRPAIIINCGDKKIVETSAGGMHSLCLTENGEVWSFGCNDEGALGRDTSEEGSEFKPQKIDLPTDCIRITAGDSHSAFLLSDGRVFACGGFRDSHGTMGLNHQGNQQYPVEIVVDRQTFVDIKSGADHLVLLTKAGLVFTVGCAEQGQLGRVSVRWSTRENRQGTKHLLEPAIVKSKHFPHIDAIWTTTYCTFVRNKDTKAIYGMGLNNYNQLGVKKDGNEAVYLPALTLFENVKSITGGQHHTLILTNDNKTYAIGRKDYGRLGVGDVSEDAASELLPIKVLDKFNVVQLECGECCSFAVTDDGKTFSWGMGSTQLGIGSDDDQIVPAQLAGAQVKERRVLNVSSGGQHTLFVVADKN